MAEIDPVILELRADLNRYQNQLRSTTTLADRSFQLQERRVLQLEQQFHESSRNITGSLRSLAGPLAAAFSAQQISSLVDGYTRLQNSIRVAGLEGADLEKVQGRLLDLSTRYGVNLESLANLFGSATQAGKELGASQGDILKLTEAVSQSLLITGTNSAQASGAILGLNQALASGIVRAEEFNQINEGGLRPLVQAAANAEQYGGSIAKLRAAVLDGKVSSDDFLKSILTYSSALSGQAANATITLSGAIEGLTSRLTVYVGQSSAALGVTNALAGGIGLLADNLDTVIPLLAGIVAGYVGVKAGALAFDAVTAAAARQLGTDQAVVAQIIKGNASYVSRAQLTAAQAAAASETAAAEVAAIESTLLARKADQAAIAETLALLERQRAESALAAKQQAFNSQLNFGLGRSVTSRDADRERQDQRAVLNTRRALTAANAQVAASETALAAAQSRAAGAAQAETAAVTANTVAKRAGAVASTLFAGAVATVGAALPFLAIAAITAAIISYATSAKDAAFSSSEFAKQGKTLSENLAIVDGYARSASASVASVGSTAATSAGQMLSFAGAVGEAAQKLETLAKARRREAFIALGVDRENARRQAVDAESRFRAAQGTFNPKVGYIGGNEQEQQAALRVYAEARRRERVAQAGMQRIGSTPLTGFVSGSERNGGRDVEGDLARVTRDLTIARERGIRSQIDSLEAQKFELQQFKKYRAQGLSPEAARDASNRDAAAFRDASAGAQGDRSSRVAASETKRLEREAQAFQRDKLADERRFESFDRKADNDIAAAKAELTNNLEARSAVEKERIERDRADRNEELRLARQQGQLGAGATGQTRMLELQRKNDERASLEKSIVDLRLQEQMAQDRLTAELAAIDNRKDVLAVESDLADTNDKRRQVALRLLDLEFEQERLRLEAIEASRTATDAEKEIARRRLASLDGLQAGQRAGVERQFEGPLARYRRGLNDPATDVQNAVAQKLQDVDDAIANAAADTLGVKDPFLRQLLQIFLQQNVLKPLYDAVAGASGGGAGGFLGTLLQIGKAAAGFAGGGGGGSTPSFGQNIEIGNILGRASGGYVPPRGLVRVNEGGPGVELLRMGSQGGTVIPLGQADRVARPAQPMVLHQTIHVDGRNSVTPAGFARQILDEANRAAAGTAAQMGQAVIKAVPARLSQFQGDGT